MCDKCNNCKGDGENIALAFNKNKVPVAAVFSKYGMGHMEVTMPNALIGVTAHGAPFATEMALAAAGANQSSFTPEEDQKNLDLAAQIFSIFGTAANAGINIGTGINNILKPNGNTGQTQTTGNTGNTGNPQVVYVQPPNQPKADNRIGGFTTGQIALLGLAVVLVVGVLVFFGNKNKA